MATLGIKAAFARYKATLTNVNWSVSAWAPDGSLVVSVWSHHSRKKPLHGTLEFEDRVNRWSGAGNTEFRRNIAKAFDTQADVRLVIVRTEEVAAVQAGEDASTFKKDFFTREDVVGKVIEWDGNKYALRFIRQLKPHLQLPGAVKVVAAKSSMLKRLVFLFDSDPLVFAG